ncbi:nitric oxide reductase activation protein NorD [Aquabacterium sp. A08]|uniref:nitric oxide reductase activation protein NorD n=1 Tax=Aquabacterium sp. A08 TaxID=2718532 RepID=UPI001420E357|nr:VWA domain-containing protein [Aquabacterium sp. A08]NIC41715.1 VWA domain-containing protein [Aquabacterium sp. A08]
MTPRAANGLGHLLTALAGADRPLVVQAHAAALPPDAPPVLTELHLSLPPAHWAGLAATPAGGLPLGSPLAQAAVAHAAAHRRHSPPARSSRGLKPLGQLVHAALEDARVERLLAQRCPGVRAWWRPWLVHATGQDLLGVPGLMAGLARALGDPGYTPSNAWVRKARDGFDAVCQRHGLADAAAFRPLASVLANDLGQMRVRFDPRQYREPVAYRDDNHHLWRHPADAEAAEHETPVPAPPRDAVARPAQPHAPSADSPAALAEPAAVVFVYPEWDATLGRHRPDWCTLTEHGPVGAPIRHGLPAAVVAPPALRGWRRPRLDRRQRPPPRREGDDIDLDALVRVWTERTRPPTPEPRVFRAPVFAPDAVSLLVLLDLSQSANDPAFGGPATVLELEIQGALALAHGLRPPDRVAVHGFRSDTRHRVSYERLLDWGQPLDAARQQGIAQVAAHGSTRMGAAIRHATGWLAAEASPQRAVCVVTDGAPSDVDVFRADHLIDDAAEAVRAARAHGVTVCGLVLDPQADAYAQRIFGQRGFQVVEQPQGVLRGMQRLLRRLAS